MPWMSTEQVESIERAAAGNLVNVRATYMHRLENERGQAIGRAGKMLRWAQTATDALTADTPRVEVALERVDEMRLICEQIIAENETLIAQSRKHAQERDAHE